MGKVTGLIGVLGAMLGASCIGDGESELTRESIVVRTDCTHTQGFWKNHPDVWPVSSLTLGTVTYSKTQLLAIFTTPVQGNGLISLAHQLIAAKLNDASGAITPAAIAQADALIGGRVVPPVGAGYLAPSTTSSLVGALDGFNSSTGYNCEREPACGDSTIDEGEQCDDGNTYDGDGCSATCEKEACCGDGTLDPGEQCDDGNTVSGDGCSSTCVCEVL
ncbi:MAG TPA: DUF4215 domain-containing protein [Kofleriaceae bacterium]|nr:DUF4215 domain-containing protein [Kofleriaceae bacterium]